MGKKKRKKVVKETRKRKTEITSDKDKQEVKTEIITNKDEQKVKTEIASELTEKAKQQERAPKIPKSPKEEKNERNKRTLGKIIGLLEKYKVGFIAVLVLGVVIAVMQVISPFILGNVTDTLINGIKNGLNMAEVAKVITILIICYAVSAGLNYIQGIVLVNVTENFVFDLKKRVQSKLKFLPLAYFDKRPTGDILSIVTNDVDTLAHGIETNLPNLASSVLTIIMVFIGMLLLSPMLTLIGLITLPLSALASLGIMRGAQKYFRGQQEGVGKIGGFIEEMFGGHDVIKAFNHEKQAVADFAEINDELYKNARRSQFVSGLVFPLSNFFSNLGYVAVVVFGGIQVVKNPASLSIGNLQTFIQLLRLFTQPIAQLSNMITEMQAAIAAAERVFEFLEEENEIADPEKPQSIKKPKGGVSLQNVQFGYSPDNILMKDLSLKVKSGDRVAIVGPTGAGKTTLVNLLLRFYELNGGKILIDNVNITKMKREYLRSLFGMVLQDTWMFEGTVMENIRYGRLDATDQEVVQAAKGAYIHEFITTQSDGYNMVIEEDAANISNGQRQLITIARAILSDPTILILDEATSQVDTRTEILIQKAMGNLMKERTSFVIAHRLSTIRDSEMIIVMDKGTIVETGNHEGLLAKNGFYADLYRNQLSGNEQE